MSAEVEDLMGVFSPILLIEHVTVPTTPMQFASIGLLWLRVVKNKTEKSCCFMTNFRSNLLVTVCFQW